jgi:hypothetical protein
LSTNLNTTVYIDICGEPAPIPSGVGGGLDFSYHAGNLTLVAPTTVDGETFVAWYVVLPSGPQEVMSNQLTLTFPAGYAPSEALLEAFYA